MIELVFDIVLFYFAVVLFYRLVGFVLERDFRQFFINLVLFSCVLFVLFL